jgi:TolB-like protein/DNA-binding SARP family transcriptional activator
MSAVAFLQLALLGGFQARAAGQEIDVPGRKERALLAFLAIPAGEARSRDKLAGLLWSDRGDSQARESLKQAVFKLRKSLDCVHPSPLRADRDCVSLERAAVAVDVAEFEQLIGEGTMESLTRAAALYRGDFLDGLDVRDAAFDEWLLMERQRLRDLAREALARLVDWHMSRGAHDQAAAATRRLLAIDPLREAAHRALMQIYAAQGQTALALKQYQLCRDVLQNELGVMPEAETERLYRSIREKRVTTIRTPSDPASVESSATSDPLAGPSPSVRDPKLDQVKQPPLPDRPSIAVLPFASFGAEQDGVYFAEGVADDIITELSRNKDLFVVARQSSFHVAQRDHDPSTIGRLLGVRYLLTGTVRRAGDRLRLSVHLIECNTGGETWAERYDRRLNDVFDVQLEVARIVTATIAGRLTALAGEASAVKAPDSFDAYDHVLRAQQFLQQYTRVDSARAREHLEAAIRADPSYARPYGLLCLAGVYEWFWQMSEDGLADVLAIGEKALSLDEHDSKTHLALAIAHLFSRHHDRAVHHLERAMTLNPNDDLIAVEHGRLLMYLDRPEEGLLRVREAMRLNPYHPNWYWNLEGRCLHSAGRYDEAIAAFERMDVRQFWVEAYLAACHAMCGHDEQAADHLNRLHAMRPDFRLNVFRRALPYRNETSLERLLETFRRAGIED